MVNVAVFASGNGGNFQSLVEFQKNLEASKTNLENQECKYNIKILITDKDNIKAIERAEKLGITHYFVNPKIYETKKEFEKKIVDILKKEDIEFIALAGYMRIIGEYFLDCYEEKIINIHPSLLPKYPGKKSIEKAYKENEVETGVTIHYVDKGVDTGKIIIQEKIEIKKEETLEELEDKIHKIEHRIYPEVLNNICENYKKKYLNKKIVLN